MIQDLMNVFSTDLQFLTNIYFAQAFMNTKPLLPDSSQCCRCLLTFRSLQFSRAARCPPSSCVSPGHGAQSAETPGRPSLMRSEWLCAASETNPVPHWSEVAVRQPGSLHLDRELCKYKTDPTDFSSVTLVPTSIWMLTTHLKE